MDETKLNEFKEISAKINQREKELSDMKEFANEEQAVERQRIEDLIIIYSI